jgi:hypothetical protein
MMNIYTNGPGRGILESPEAPLCGLLLIAFSLQSGTAAEPERNVDGIMDNSFLVEEAYNQEKGIVQHIGTAQYGVRTGSGPDDQFWQLAFTQEWPLFSQTHQLSYTIPYTSLHTAGQTDSGLGDVMLNYRLQAYFHEETLTAFAPRASLILPTGDPDLGLGEDTVGFQGNLPFSTTIGDKAFLHLNAGFTYLPNSASAGDRDLTHFNSGASFIYAPLRDLNFMLEWVGYWNETRNPGASRERGFLSLISPGVRKAFDFAESTQLVLGLGVPIGLTDESPDIGVFLYISFEHPFTSNR